MGFFSSIRNLFQAKTDQPDAVEPAQQVQAAQTEQEHTAEPVSDDVTISDIDAGHKIHAPHAEQAQAEQTPVPPVAMAASPQQAPANEQEATPLAQEQPGLFASAEYKAMTATLRGAEPRLSAWLEVVLQGVTQADALL